MLEPHCQHDDAVGYLVLLKSIRVIPLLCAFQNLTVQAHCIGGMAQLVPHKIYLQAIW